MAPRRTTKATSDAQADLSPSAILQRLDERISIIERALHDEPQRAVVSRRWSTERDEARRRAITEFDYADLLQRQPETVRRLRDHYARLNAFLVERGFEPVQNQFTT